MLPGDCAQFNQASKPGRSNQSCGTLAPKAIKTKRGPMADPAPKQVSVLDFVQPLGYSNALSNSLMTRTRSMDNHGPFL
jgi:hypothetical protein